MNGFEYAQGIHDNLAEPNTEEVDDTPPCGGNCTHAYACIHCGPDPD